MLNLNKAQATKRNINLNQRANLSTALHTCVYVSQCTTVLYNTASTLIIVPRSLQISSLLIMPSAGGDEVGFTFYVTASYTEKNLPFRHDS